MASGIKSQSAMEYLMTYGWAILIIAVVLGALFQLGVFSGIGTPKAQAGNCQVVKVGTGTTQTVSLAGECQGQEPEYVTSFPQSLAIGNYIKIQNMPFNGINDVTVAVWVNLPVNTTVSHQAILDCFTCPGSGLVLLTYSLPSAGAYSMQFYVYNSLGFLSPVAQTSYMIQPNKWYFLTATYNGLYLEDYVNAVQSTTSCCVEELGPLETGIAPTGSTWIGAQGGSYQFHGQLANLQIYNATLSQAEITALYQEGIGGAPINPQHIVGWWPLNGNLNDYSGSNNNGNFHGSGSTMYSSFWTNGYTAP